MEKEKRFFGEKVKQILEDRRLTVLELATRAGVSQGALSNWINGVRNPRRSNINAIAKILGCRISDISGYSDEDFQQPDEVDFDFVKNPDRQTFLDRVVNELKYQSELEGQQKTADRLGISKSHLWGFCNGSVEVGNMSLTSFLNLFPKMRIQLRGSVPQDSVEEIQNIIDCMSEDELNKMLAVLKIVFPQYVK